MNYLEIISGLCEVVQILTILVNKQAEVIGQADVADAVAQDLRLLRGDAEKKYRQIVGESEYPTASKDGGD